MFKKYRDLAYLDKLINKHRKMCEQSPETGYSAVIAHMMHLEAEGVFKTYPAYTHNTVNNFFAECVNKFRQTNWIRTSAVQQNKQVSEISDETLVFSAVVAQAIFCKDMTEDQALDNLENTAKILVNMKLLPERALDDSELEIRVV